MVIRDLVLPDTGLWDVDKIIELFGYEKSMAIVSSNALPSHSSGHDELIFLSATNGSYSVKMTYNKLKKFEMLSGQGQRNVWDVIWKRGEVVPRVRLLLWKLLHIAIPLGSVMKRRFPAEDPTCVTCGSGVEDVSHMIFLCNFARMCWFVRPLGMRSNLLTQTMHEVLLKISEEVDDDLWLKIANSMWALWRCRNDMAYGGRVPTFESFSKYLAHINLESMLGATRRCNPSGRVEQVSSQTLAPNRDFCCFMDGS